MAGPLLRYSLAEFAEIIFTSFRIADVRKVMEIGSEAGLFTRQLVEWVERRGGSLFCVEPSPTKDVLELVGASPSVRLLQETSHDALAHAEPVDAYLVDGDHNYFTVTGELEGIERAARRADRAVIVFLQDVDWPCGRRDFYYAPERLPAEAVHPHTFDLGVVPGSDEPVVGGFRGDGHFACALHQGGPRNGVRTALEDFLAGHPGWVVRHVPCVFGLCVVFPEDAPWSAELGDFLDCYHENPMLVRLETNRIDLYLKVLELQDQLAALRLHYEGLSTERDTQLRATETAMFLAQQEARTARVDASRSQVPEPESQARRAPARQRRAVLGAFLRRAMDALLARTTRG